MMMILNRPKSSGARSFQRTKQREEAMRAGSFYLEQERSPACWRHFKRAANELDDATATTIAGGGACEPLVSEWPPICHEPASSV